MSIHFWLKLDIDPERNVYVEIWCKDCNQGLTQKNYLRHNKSIKHKKNEKLSLRKGIIERANEDEI